MQAFYVHNRMARYINDTCIALPLGVVDSLYNHLSSICIYQPLEYNAQIYHVVIARVGFSNT